MARHLWTVICNESSIDQDSKRLSLFGILEGIGLSEEPEKWPVNLPLAFEVISLWCRSDYNIPEKARGRIVLEDSAGPEIKEPYEINLSEGFIHFRFRARFVGITVPSFETKWFVVQSEDNGDWLEVARIPFFINHTPDDA